MPRSRPFLIDIEYLEGSPNFLQGVIYKKYKIYIFLPVKLKHSKAQFHIKEISPGNQNEAIPANEIT